MNTVRSPLPGATQPTRTRRDGQREALVEAAERAIAGGGIAALKARDLARDIGVSLGALYNLVADLDELGMLVASRTLARLERCVIAAGTAMPASEVADSVRRLVVFARAYRSFACDHPELWRALFDHRTADRRPFPQALVADQLRLFEHVTMALRPLKPAADEAELLLLTRTLFGAVHGVVALGLDEKLVAVPADALDRQLELLVTAFCNGL